MKKQTKILLLAFLAIGAFKIFLDIQMGGPIIFPDETCALLRAQYFIKHFGMETCDNIAKSPGGSPEALYSILISPVFLFFSGIKAFKAIMAINAIITATLIFPLFWLYKKFIENDAKALVIAVITTFIPHIVGYEQNVMTELPFIIVNIWFLHFYMESFYTHKKRNKIIAVGLSLAAIITRPFGFITPIALVINEFTHSKHKKKIIIPLIVLGALFIQFVLFKMQPELPNLLIQKLEYLGTNKGFVNFLQSIANQINSFTVATFMVPCLVFFTAIFSTKDESIKKIRFFLISFIIMNFAISAQHIFGYFIEEGRLDLLTRYVNSSIIFILIFSTIFLIKEYKFVINKVNIAIIAIFSIPLFFLENTVLKRVMNVEITQFYYHNVGLMKVSHFFEYLFIPFTIVLILLFILNKTKIYAYTLVITFLVLSVHSHFHTKFFTNAEQSGDPSWVLFEDTNYRILTTSEAQSRLSYWRLKTLTSNDVVMLKPGSLEENVQGIMDTYKNYDYIITKNNLPFQLVAQSRFVTNIYKTTPTTLEPNSDLYKNK